MNTPETDFAERLFLESGLAVNGPSLEWLKRANTAQLHGQQTQLLVAALTDPDFPMSQWNRVIAMRRLAALESEMAADLDWIKACANSTESAHPELKSKLLVELRKVQDAHPDQAPAIGRFIDWLEGFYDGSLAAATDGVNTGSSVPSLVASAPGEQPLPSLQGAPWTMCGVGAMLMMTGSVLIVGGLDLFVFSGSTATPVAVALITTGGAVMVGGAVALASGCGTGPKM